jgi:antitoxin ParD1/3/4
MPSFLFWGAVRCRGITNIAILCYRKYQSMNVSLTPQLERFVERKVREGRYQTASGVVREALRLLVDRDERRALEFDRLRQDIRLGLDDIRAGRVTDFDMKRLKAEAKKEMSPRKLKRVG